MGDRSTALRWLKEGHTMDLCHRQQFDLSQSAGVTQNVNKGSVPFYCPSKPWQWAYMHNVRTTSLLSLISLFRPMLGPLWRIQRHLAVTLQIATNRIRLPSSSSKLEGEATATKQKALCRAGTRFVQSGLKKKHRCGSWCVRIIHIFLKWLSC